MSTAELSFACAWTLVDELVRGGVRHACVSPGSRSTPLALALDRHPGMTTHVHLDERSSAFVALGLAKALREPVAVGCTSGTAAAELFPAVVEASQSRVPLIVLTADRPPHLRGTGANQTIDQVELYGRYVRWFADAETPDPSTADLGRWTSLGASALASSRSEPPGPVHINLPFSEPLVPSGGEAGIVGTDRPTVAPPASALGPGAVERLIEELRRRRRGVIVATSLRRDAPTVTRLAGSLGWPLIAEPASGLRRPGSALAAGTLLSDAWDPEGVDAPDIVVRVGPPSIARATQRLLDAGISTAIIDTESLDPDPELTVASIVQGDAEAVAGELLRQDLERDPDEEWLGRWQDADTAARIAIDTLLDSWDEPSEMRVARDLAAAIPGGGTLFVGNSMPVRDLDAFMAPREGLRVLGNRGASGIDGLLSTALGIAAAGTGPTFALLGDLSFLYDAGALLWNARREAGLVVVVNDNGGGQVFAGLGQRALPADELERLFVTPHGVHLEQLCAVAGAEHTRVERAADLVPALDAAGAGGGLRVVLVTIDAELDRARRVEVRAAVARARESIVPR